MPRSPLTFLVAQALLASTAIAQGPPAQRPAPLANAAAISRMRAPSLGSSDLLTRIRATQAGQDQLTKLGKTTNDIATTGSVPSAITADVNGPPTTTGVIAGTTLHVDLSQYLMNIQVWNGVVTRSMDLPASTSTSGAGLFAQANDLPPGTYAYAFTYAKVAPGDASPHVFVYEYGTGARMDCDASTASTRTDASGVSSCIVVVTLPAKGNAAIWVSLVSGRAVPLGVTIAKLW